MAKRISAILLTLAMLVSMVSMATFTVGAESTSTPVCTIDFNVTEEQSAEFADVGDTVTVGDLTYIKLESDGTYFTPEGGSDAVTGTGGGLNGGGIMGVSGITFEAGKTYTVAGQMKGNNATFTFGVYNADDQTAIATDSVPAVHDGSWGFTPFSGSFTIPEDADVSNAIFVMSLDQEWLRLDDLVISVVEEDEEGGEEAPTYSELITYDFNTGADDDTMKKMWGSEYTTDAYEGDFGLSLSRWGQFALTNDFAPLTTYTVTGYVAGTTTETLQLKVKTGPAQSETEPDVQVVDIPVPSDTEFTQFEVTLTMPTNTGNVWILVKSEGAVDGSTLFVDNIQLQMPAAKDQLQSAVTATDCGWNGDYATEDSWNAFESALAAAKAALENAEATDETYTAAYTALVKAAQGLVWQNPEGVYNDFENNFFGANVISRPNVYGHAVSWSTEKPQAGVYSLQMTEGNPWNAGDPYGDGFDYYNYAVVAPGDGSATYDASSYDVMTLWVFNGADAARVPQIILEDADGAMWDADAAEVVAEAAAGEWTKLSIDLADVGEADLSKLAKISLGFNGAEGAVSYFDGIGFEAAEPDPDPDPEPTPTPTEDSVFNDFESDNTDKLLPGDGLTAEIVTDDVNGGTSAVKIDKTADGSDYPQAALTVLPAAGGTFDASGYGYLTFWLKDTQGDNSLAFFILDADGNMQSGWTDNLTVARYTGKGVKDEWTKFVIDLSKFGDVDLSKIEALAFAEWNTGVYYLDDITFVLNPYSAKEQLLMLLDEADAIHAAGQKYFTDASWEYFMAAYEQGVAVYEYIDTLTEDECEQLVALGREAIDGLTLDSSYVVTDYTTSTTRGGGYGFGDSGDAVMRFQTFYAAETGKLDSVDVLIGGNGNLEDRSDLVAHICTVGGENGYTPLEVLATVTIEAALIPSGDSVVNIPIQANLTKGEKYALVLTTADNNGDDYGWITFKDVTDENGDLNFIKIKGTEVVGSELQDESGLGVGYLKAYIQKDQGTVEPPAPVDDTLWFNDFEGDDADASILFGNDANGGLSEEAYQGNTSVNLNVTVSGWPSNANRIVWVLPDSGETIDASGYDYLIFWVLDTQGPNSLDVYFQDENGNGKNGWTTTNAVKDEWTKFVVDISAYGEAMDMTKLMAIGFTEYNEGEYYIDAVYFSNDPEAEMPGGDPTPTPTVPGDVNEDGVVDSKDARLILQATVQLAELSEAQQVLADVNEDNVIDSKDARMVLQMTVAA